MENPLAGRTVLVTGAIGGIGGIGHGGQVLICVADVPAQSEVRRPPLRRSQSPRMASPQVSGLFRFLSAADRKGSRLPSGPPTSSR